MNAVSPCRFRCVGSCKEGTILCCRHPPATSNISLYRTPIWWTFTKGGGSNIREGGEGWEANLGERVSQPRAAAVTTPPPPLQWGNPISKEKESHSIAADPIKLQRRSPLSTDQSAQIPNQSAVGQKSKDCTTSSHRRVARMSIKKDRTYIERRIKDWKIMTNCWNKCSIISLVGSQKALAAPTPLEI